jgi:ABC-type branched-subunit amino acid transport system ATPase component
VPVDLDVRDVTVRFGGVTALSEVSLHAKGGQITGLIGPNGAGKTTLFNVCTGIVRPTHGSIHLGDQRLDGHGSANRAHRGLGRTFQRMELFESMTVWDNVRTGPEALLSSRRVWGQLIAGRGEAKEIRERAASAIARCGLQSLQDRIVNDLSTGQRRLVELARAIASPFSFLLLDEPASGLDMAETTEFGEVLKGFVQDTGTGVLLVEHDMSLVADVCVEIHVLDFGKLIYSGTTQEALSSELVRAAYLGQETVDV